MNYLKNVPDYVYLNKSVTSLTKNRYEEKSIKNLNSKKYFSFMKSRRDIDNNTSNNNQQKGTIKGNIFLNSINKSKLNKSSNKIDQISAYNWEDEKIKTL